RTEGRPGDRIPRGVERWVEFPLDVLNPDIGDLHAGVFLLLSLVVRTRSMRHSAAVRRGRASRHPPAPGRVLSHVVMLAGCRASTSHQLLFALPSEPKSCAVCN